MRSVEFFVDGNLDTMTIPDLYCNDDCENDPLHQVKIVESQFAEA